MGDNMRKVRSFYGNDPIGEEWRKADEIFDIKDADWAIWYHTKSAQRKYVNFKIVAKGTAKAKANYWISIGPGGRSPSRDLGIMKDNSPELFEAVKKCMDQVYSEEIGQ
jgi:hypothetical protein